jgi:hypothetical protein
VWNRLALLGQQARIQSFWRALFSLSHTDAPPASPVQLIWESLSMPPPPSFSMMR